MNKLLFPTFVIVPPCFVPGFMFTYSLNLLLSPIINEFSSPLYFKSWGGVPIDENGKISLLTPIDVFPTILIGSKKTMMEETYGPTATHTTTITI